MNIETYDALLVEWKNAMRESQINEADIEELQETGIDTLLALKVVGFSEAEGWSFIDECIKDDLDEDQIRNRVIKLLNPK